MTHWHARAVSLRKEGHTFAEIGLLLGITKGGVYNALSPAERIPNTQRIRVRAETQAWRAVAATLYEQGLGYAEIGRRLGKHPNTVFSGLSRGSRPGPTARAKRPVRIDNARNLEVGINPALPLITGRTVYGTGHTPGVSGDTATVLEALCASEMPLAVPALARRCGMARDRVTQVLAALRDEGRAHEARGGWTWGK